MAEVTIIPGRNLERAVRRVKLTAALLGPNHTATQIADVEATRLSLELKAGLVDRSAAELYPDDTAQLLSREVEAVRRKLTVNGTS